MEYEDRIVGFIDILGFSDVINRTIKKDGSDNNELIESIDNALANNALISEPAPEWSRKLEGYKEPSAMQVTQFSDSIVISCLADKPNEIGDMLIELFWIQVALLEHGMLCRGGVTRGRLLHTPHVLFGPAFVTAYKLESEAALYPRIVLGQEIYDLIESSYNPQMKRWKWNMDSLAKRDGDGMYYLNYFDSPIGTMHDEQWDEHLDRLRAKIEEGMKITSPGIRIKYQWMKEKYDHCDHTRRS